MLMLVACAVALQTAVGNKAVLLFVSLLVVAAMVGYSTRWFFSLARRKAEHEEAPLWTLSLTLASELMATVLSALALSYVAFVAWRALMPRSDVVAAGATPFVLVHGLFVVAFVLVPDVLGRLQKAEAARVAQRNAERLRVNELQRSLAMSELKMLQAQIEPHFLYNVLANVQSMVKLAPETADAMLQHLIDYLKLALPSMRGGESTVDAELSLARAYLGIAQLRFGDRLQVAVTSAGDIGDVAMPPMLLMPLVENAIKHGVEPKPGLVRVEVNVHRLDGRLLVRVSDDGAGFRIDAGSGIGIANVRERLVALFGDRATVNLEARPDGGVVATLSIPL